MYKNIDLSENYLDIVKLGFIEVNSQFLTHAYKVMQIKSYKEISAKEENINFIRKFPILYEYI